MAEQRLLAKFTEWCWPSENSFDVHVRSVHGRYTMHDRLHCESHEMFQVGGRLGSAQDVDILILTQLHISL